LKRVLVIRGGAIGDFILTLPALKVLRDAHPSAHIEILGYKHIAALAENRFYAQAVRSIEYGSLSSFFAKNSELPTDLANFFSSFDLILSYLYDPDGIFENNLRLSGAKNLVRGPARIETAKHPARQLAQPLEELGLRVDDFAARIFPSNADRSAAEKFISGFPHPLVVFHPGSGSETKNWPLENWIDIGNHLLARTDFRGSIVVVSGEADEIQVRQLRTIWRNGRVQFAENLPLPELSALFANTIFLGHDSGISHLAAAAGANCILLFGPTDPAVWAPANPRAHIIRAPQNDLRALDVELVRAALSQALMRIGMST